MNNVLRQIEIDLYSPTSYEVIKAQQGDKNSRVIEFILYDQRKPYVVSDNVVFSFDGHRGDGSSFSKMERECITRNGNHISVTLLEDILYYAGTIEAKLVMYESSKKSFTEPSEETKRTVLSTIPFKISCTKDPCNKNNLSEGENSIITDLTFRVEEFEKTSQDVIDLAKQSADVASEKAGEASDSANKAKISEHYAQQYSESAGNSESAAEAFANVSEAKSIEAGDWAALAESFAHGGTNTRTYENTDNAMAYAKAAQSYAVGDTDYRLNEANDCAKSYYEQAKAISNSFSGALRPMGTVTFANLPALTDAVEGNMYNISDQFTTNADFKEGSGLTIPAGSNVYKTAADGNDEGKWDVLAGSPVTGVKGHSETTYRKGNVSITKENIGLGNVDNTADKDKSVKKATQDGDGNVIKDSYAVRKVVSGDFNDFIKPGIYAVVASQAAHRPESDISSYGLIVAHHYSDHMYTQIAFGYKSYNAYIRTGDDAGGSAAWTAWKQIYVEGNISQNAGIKKDIVDLIYPVGSIYMSVNSTSPATLFGGTWVRWGNGRVPVGVDTSQTEFNTVGKTGGSKTHSLTTEEMPSHTHSVSSQTVATTSNGEHTHTLKYNNTANAQGTAARINGNGTILAAGVVGNSGAHTHNVTIPASTTDSTGTDNAHNNLQPYITCYMWKRTA